MTVAVKHISIIIPVYNGGKTLDYCLESVFKSAYPNFECIVVDDHSSDNSLSIAEKYDVKLTRLNKQRGAAYARNCGAEAAKGDIIFFIDADVTIYEDTLLKVEKSFRQNPDIAAIFGSYDDQPGCSNFFSQYKNLFHHYVHQTSLEDAATFWSGCGAIKADIFKTANGFDHDLYSKATIEDIDLGYRLKGMGYKIHLNKDLQVKHLKKWNFFSMIRADIFYRAVPWSMLILRKQNLINDLNLQTSDRISAGLVCLIVGFIPFLLVNQKLIYFILILLGMVFTFNYRLYVFFFKLRGIKFALFSFIMHLFYFFYSTVTFASCWVFQKLFNRKILMRSTSR